MLFCKMGFFYVQDYCKRYFYGERQPCFTNMVPGITRFTYNINNSVTGYKGLFFVETMFTEANTLKLAV